MAYDGIALYFIIKLYLNKTDHCPKSQPVLKINKRTSDFITNIQYLSPGYWFFFSFFSGVEINHFVHAVWLVPFQQAVPRASKVQQWVKEDVGRGFPLDNCGLIKVCSAVLALRWVTATVGQLGIPHLTLALPQLSNVTLEAQAELRVLSLGCFKCPLLQMYPLNIHHLLNRLCDVSSISGWFDDGALVCSSFCAWEKRNNLGIFNVYAYT